MGPATRATLSFVLAGCCLAASSRASQDGVFRGAAPYVPIYATVIGADGRLITDLERRDFVVFDNGRPRPIDVFDSRPQPIHIVVMLDMSGSMLGNLPVLLTAAEQFFARLQPGDQVRVGGFGDRVQISSAFTDNAAELSRALRDDFRAGGSTPLWGAVDAAMTTLAPLEGRRVVLVLSDGYDTGIWADGRKISPSAVEILSRARREEIMTYAIGMRSRGAPARPGLPAPRFPDDQPDPSLRALAEETGGGYFELTGTEDLGAVFGRVADELRRQYLIGFSATEPDGAVHTIDVRVARTASVVRARRSYVAPVGPKAKS